MRLFISLKTNLDRKKIFSYEKKLMRLLTNVKWVDRENLHLTLKFLGETPDEIKDKVNLKLREITENFSPFDFYYSGISAFPNLLRARVLFIAVRDGDKIIRLMKSVDDAMYELGFDREKSYVPHLTLGRVKKGVINLKRISLPDFGGENVKAYGVTLIKSTLTRRGPIYENISEFDFS